MTAYFADTSYYVALLSPRDARHQQAVGFAADPDVAPVTTEFVLLELAAFFAKPPLRDRVIEFIEGLPHFENMTIIRCDSAVFDAGWEVFGSHRDKSWSLVDCISFAVMRARGIREALTADHHFEQAGFTAMMKP
jgi:predicted nucleic acid-binding protein